MKHMKQIKPETQAIGGTALRFILAVGTLIQSYSSLAQSECGAAEQTADHVPIACFIHRAPHGARGLRILDDETRCWLYNITASI